MFLLHEKERGDYNSLVYFRPGTCINREDEISNLSYLCIRSLKKEGFHPILNILLGLQIIRIDSVRKNTIHTRNNIVTELLQLTSNETERGPSLWQHKIILAK